MEGCSELWNFDDFAALSCGISQIGPWISQNFLRKTVGPKHDFLTDGVEPIVVWTTCYSHCLRATDTMIHCRMPAGRRRSMFLWHSAWSTSCRAPRSRRGEWSPRRWKHDRCRPAILASVHVLVWPRPWCRLWSYWSCWFQFADGLSLCTSRWAGHATRCGGTHRRRTSLRDWTGLPISLSGSFLSF